MLSRSERRSVTRARDPALGVDAQAVATDGVTHRREKPNLMPFESTIVTGANEPRRQAPIGDGQGPLPTAELPQSLIGRRARRNFAQ
jgi:hypothetical protein